MEIKAVFANGAVLEIKGRGLTKPFGCSVLLCCRDRDTEPNNSIIPEATTSPFLPGNQPPLKDLREDGCGMLTVCLAWGCCRVMW